MSVPVIFLPEVKTDIAEAYAQYEGRRRGLGDRFLDQLRRRIEAISDNPELYAVLQDTVRAAPLRRFPYVIYYRIEEGVAHVLGVIHGHRDPRVWMRRV